MDRTKNKSYTQLFKIKVVKADIKAGSNRKAVTAFSDNEKNISLVITATSENQHESPELLLQ